MMDLQTKTRQFVDDLQRYSNRKLVYPEEVGYLLDQATLRGLDQPLRDAIFHAKFAVKTREIMGRIGRDGEGFDKLSVEFENSIEKTSTLLKTIVKESPEEIKQHFIRDFFSLDQSSFGNFIRLLEDLGWVKNYEIDGRQLPLSGSPTKRSSHDRSEHPSKENVAEQSVGDIARIRNGASFGFVLMILLLFVDPPLTILGWGLIIVVMLLLSYVAIVSHTFAKKP
jgi:hypothetical protein